MNIFSPVQRPIPARDDEEDASGESDSVGTPPVTPPSPDDAEIAPLHEADEAELSRMASQLRLEDDDPDATRRDSAPNLLTLMVPNPFDAPATPSDEPMPTTSPNTPKNLGPVAGSQGPRVTAAHALPQSPRFTGCTMEARRAFMRAYETYLTAINALQTQWGGAFAVPVGACIEGRTKRMIARYEFRLAPERVSEEQLIAYFLQAKTPTHVDYATVDIAMRELVVKTDWSEPERRMMNLQADLEAILDRFNLVDVAFEREQKKLVKYLGNALAPDGFKRIVATRLSLQEHKKYRTDVVAYCTWVTSMMREFIGSAHNDLGRFALCCCGFWHLWWPSRRIAAPAYRWCARRRCEDGPSRCCSSETANPYDPASNCSSGSSTRHDD